MLATSKNVLFPGHNHLLTTGANDPSLYHLRWGSGDNQSVRSSVPVVSKWLWPGNKTLLEVASMVITWWIVPFFGPVGGSCFAMMGTHRFFNTYTARPVCWREWIS